MADSAASHRASSPSSGQRWLFGPVPDLLLGCGLGYLVFFVLQATAGPQMRSWVPIQMAPFFVLLFGAPHYGATLLRVYSQREDRRKYALFAVWATAMLAASFVVGLNHFMVGSLLVTVYITWSPWHYAGQNYGIAVLFLRRRGVPVTPRAKRLLYGTFIFSYVLVFLNLHGRESFGVQVPFAYQTGSVYGFVVLGIPDSVREVAALAAGSAYAACLLGALWQLRGRASLRDLGPTLALVFSQALWFLVPALVIYVEQLGRVDPLSSAHRQYAFLWVAMGHYLQYLWITTYHAEASGSAGARLRYLLKTLLAGSALFFVPAFLFAPGLLGSVPNDFGLSLLVAAVVNLHHFILDGAIWKLRDGRLARVLLRTEPAISVPPLAEGVANTRQRWGWAVAWLAGALALGVAGAGHWQAYQGDRAARHGDTARAQESYRFLARIGRKSPRALNTLARWAVEREQLPLARRRLQESLALYPTVEAWMMQGQLEQNAGDWKKALVSYRGALRVQAEHPGALYRMARLWLDQGRTDRARPLLERAAAADPDNAVIRLALERFTPPGPVSPPATLPGPR